MTQTRGDSGLEEVVAGEVWRSGQIWDFFEDGDGRTC